MTSTKYIGMDVHKEYADFLIMPNTKRSQRRGRARVASRVGIIIGFPGLEAIRKSQDRYD